jgi:hypothetical protein
MARPDAIQGLNGLDPLFISLGKGRRKKRKLRRQRGKILKPDLHKSDPHPPPTGLEKSVF